MKKDTSEDTLRGKCTAISEGVVNIIEAGIPDFPSWNNEDVLPIREEDPDNLDLPFLRFKANRQVPLQKRRTILTLEKRLSTKIAKANCSNFIRGVKGRSMQFGTYLARELQELGSS